MIASVLSALILVSAPTRSGGVDPLRPSVLGVQLLRTPFRSLQDELGTAPWARVDLPHQPSVIVFCYRINTGTRWTYVVFESGPNGGYGDVVSGFVLATSPPERIRPDDQHPSAGSHLCVDVKRRLPPGPLLSNGLDIGMSRKEVLDRLGAPGRQHPSSVEYVNDDRVSKLSAGDWAELTITFEQGRVTVIRGVRSEML